MDHANLEGHLLPEALGSIWVESCMLPYHHLASLTDHQCHLVVASTSTNALLSDNIVYIRQLALVPT